MSTLAHANKPDWNSRRALWKRSFSRLISVQGRPNCRNKMRFQILPAYVVHERCSVSNKIRSPEQLTPHLFCLFPSRALQQRFRAFTICTFMRLVALSNNKDRFTSPAGNTYINLKNKSTERRVTMLFVRISNKSIKELRWRYRKTTFFEVLRSCFLHVFWSSYWRLRLSEALN